MSMNKAEIEEKTYSRTKADFWMFDVCPECQKKLDQHSQREYCYCEAIWRGLDPDTPTLCLNCDSKTEIRFSDGTCPHCHSAFIRGIESTKSILVTSQGSKRLLVCVCCPDPICECSDCLRCSETEEDSEVK